MIAVELIAALLTVTCVLFAIVKVGAPIADAFAERLKLKFQELGPEDERQLRNRLEALEEEMRSLKQQVLAIQDTTDFSKKLGLGALPADLSLEYKREK